MTNQKKKLPPDVEASVKARMAELQPAKARGDDGAFEKALVGAWSLIPEPRIDYDFYPQALITMIIRHYQRLGQSETAEQWLPALHSVYPPDDPGTRFIEGCVLMDAGKLDEAWAVFDRLHREHGRRPFQGYDTKYHRFYQSRTKR